MSGYPYRPLTTAQKAVFNRAAAWWMKVITGPTKTLTVYANAMKIDGPGGILGQAGPFGFDRTGFPTKGITSYDYDDLAMLEQSGELYPVIQHEFAHLLGFGTIWDDREVLNYQNRNNPVFTGKNAVQAYKTLRINSGDEKAVEQPVPVEATGGDGTALSHWRETTFQTELMTGWINYASDKPSIITLASMVDLGWQVNPDMMKQALKDYPRLPLPHMLAEARAALKSPATKITIRHPVSVRAIEKLKQRKAHPLPAAGPADLEELEERAETAESLLEHLQEQLETLEKLISGGAQ